MLDTFNLAFGFLTLCSLVMKIPVLVSLARWLYHLCHFWVVFHCSFLVMGGFFLLLCMSGFFVCSSFILDARCYEVYCGGCWIFLHFYKYL